MENLLLAYYRRTNF